MRENHRPITAQPCMNRLTVTFPSCTLIENPHAHVKVFQMRVASPPLAIQCDPVAFFQPPLSHLVLTDHLLIDNHCPGRRFRPWIPIQSDRIPIGNSRILFIPIGSGRNESSSLSESDRNFGLLPMVGSTRNFRSDSDNEDSDSFRPDPIGIKRIR